MKKSTIYVPVIKSIETGMSLQSQKILKELEKKYGNSFSYK